MNKNTAYKINVIPGEFLFDAESDKKDISLEAHFKDVYITLTKKLGDFALRAESTDAEHEQLRKLLSELIWVRNLMQK